VNQSPLGMRALGEYACRLAERETKFPLRPTYACATAKRMGADPQSGSVEIPDKVLKEAYLGVHDWTPGAGDELKKVAPKLYDALEGTSASYHALARSAVGEDILRNAASVAKYAIPRHRDGAVTIRKSESKSSRSRIRGERF